MTSRRSLLALPAAATLACPALAQTPPGIVMAVWGGGGALVWRESFVPEFTAATNIPVRIVEVPNPAGALRSPAAATQYTTALVTYFEAMQLAKAGLIETFTRQELPTLGDVTEAYQPGVAGGRFAGIPVYFTFYGIAFNTTLARPEDFTSWNNLTEPRWRGRIAITRPVYAASYDLVIMAKARGGDERNVAPGYPLLRAVVENSLTTYSSLAHMNTLLTRGEAAAVPYYASRVWSLRRQGVSDIGITIPREGALMLPYVIVVPKGMRNREVALRWMNHTGSAAPQAKAAAMDGWLPMNSATPLPAELEQLIGSPLPRLMEQLYAPDWNVIVEHQEARMDEIERLMASVRR